jgi:RNA-directed DNA polymerase
MDVRKTETVNTKNQWQCHESDNRAVAKQAGDTHHDPRAEESFPRVSSDRWWWVERCIWTERMLNALEAGVKGGKWFSLMDKVFSPENLSQSFDRVRKNRGAAGVDNQSIAMFSRHRKRLLEDLHKGLVEGTYRPLPVLRCWIDKAGSKDKRPLGIPAVRDRVVQTALRCALEPIFEVGFAEHSYGFRPGRSALDAVVEVDQLLKSGNTWVVDADLKSYFDTIPHDRLVHMVREKVRDGRVLDLVGKFLNQGIMEDMKLWVPEKGTPQGAVISPLLSNIYLDPLDKAMREAGYEMIRYADDFVIVCSDEQQAKDALHLVREWTASNGLELHPDKTRIVDATQHGGFDFLGYHFERGMKWPRSRSEKKLKDTVRLHTRRCNGKSLERVIALLNPVLRGWSRYFRYSLKGTFDKVDGWVRMRLRSILRKRRGGRGRGRGNDHWRWPNAYFERMSLYSTTKAHVA